MRPLASELGDFALVVPPRVVAARRGVLQVRLQIRIDCVPDGRLMLKRLGDRLLDEHPHLGRTFGAVRAQILSVERVNIDRSRTVRAVVDRYRATELVESEVIAWIGTAERMQQKR